MAQSFIVHIDSVLHYYRDEFFHRLAKVGAYTTMVRWLIRGPLVQIQLSS